MSLEEHSLLPNTDGFAYVLNGIKSVISLTFLYFLFHEFLLNKLFRIHLFHDIYSFGEENEDTTAKLPVSLILLLIGI